MQEDNAPPVSDTIDLFGITVEDSYKGPRMEGMMLIVMEFLHHTLSQ